MTSAVSPLSAIGQTPELYLRRAIEKWFFDTPIERICRQNFKQWVSCYFFYKDISELSEEHSKEADDIVAVVEKAAKHSFAEGLDSSVRSANLNLDPPFATQRPLVIYICIWIANWLAHLYLRFLGFQKVDKGCGSGSGSGSGSEAQFLYRRPAKNKQKPVVFIHGLGVGLSFYVRLISYLPDDVDVFLLEWPHVGMQLATEVPTIEETKRLFASALSFYGHASACFVGHSLGTTAVSWMLRDPAYSHLVSSTVQLDPVTFLLCDPTVATVFLYKTPTTVLDLGMHFFISRELNISHTLQRHFSWSHNICFAEDLLPSKEMQRESNARNTDDPISQIHHTVILSSHDSIVPAGPVSRYLDLKKEKFRKNGTDCFETLVFHGHHSEMLLYPSWLKIIRNRVKRLTR
eukprot:GSChrysophyteH1.ASY1.ANO1.2500.1 assembled CDS